MEKRKWLWKKKSLERSPGETDSSGSSLSERYSDEQQEEVKDSPNDHTQSPEVTSKVVVADEEVADTVKNLTAKLSAALINVSVKEDLVKQHAKVAEEAVAGWEKAENEVTALKQQLEAAVQQNLALEVRASHLDSALKECVRQLRQARDEQEARINDAVAEKTNELESVKIELENQLHQLQTNVESTLAHYPASADLNIRLKLESLEKENSILKFELLSRSEELEIRTIERDLSTQAAETASKQQLESIKKVAKLEAECRRLQTIARKSSSSYDHKSAASSVCAESVTDSQPDSGDREPNKWERNCSDSWASALITELDQFKNEKRLAKDSLASSVEIDMMDDFLEMERLVALPDTQSKFPSLESEAMAFKSSAMENLVKPELETMINRIAELEERLKKTEQEKTELQRALTESEDSLRASQAQLKEAESRLEDLQKELCVVNEAKELLEFQLIGMEVEARTLSANVDSLNAEVQKERSSSAKMAVKYQESENELIKKLQEIELQQVANTNSELKIKQEDLVVAADKLAECQQTIASLGKQLQSLATLEDFLIDTSNLPGFSGNKAMVTGSTEWKARANDAFVPKYESDPSRTPAYTSSLSMNGNEGESPASSSSSTSSANSTSARTRNGFVRLFSRSKSGIQLENNQG